MRICFICCEYPPAKHGGIGSVTQVLGRALVSAGHEVKVVGVYPRSSAFSNSPEYDQGVEVHRLPAPEGRLAWTKARKLLYQAISNWARRGEIDVVEVPDWEGYAAGWPSLSVPVVTRLHGSSSYFAREMHARLDLPAWCLEAASFHRADDCCSTSAYTATQTQKIFGPRRRPVEVLWNPVEIPVEKPAENGAARKSSSVIFAGTLTPKKGVRPLIESWPAVVRESPDAELHLYGKDEGMQAQLTALLPDDVRETVHFHGHVTRERVKVEFQTCRLAVFPSYAEAFSMVPLEAMAQGCPVIYSDRHSGPELIQHGINGLLIDPDRPEQLSEAILRLLRDDAAAARIGAAGRADVARRFATGVLLARNEAFYRKAVHGS
jgi:glycosyltransferase involved in cell wall biosynthesis